jgi:maltose O-acetyltransferase
MSSEQQAMTDDLGFEPGEAAIVQMRAKLMNNQPAKTEKEKMLAGETYNCLDAALEAERQQIKKLLRRYNQTEDLPERQTILRQLLGQVGQDSIVEPPFHCVYGHNIHIGDHVYINVLCTILDCGAVHIGRHVMIGPGVQIYTAAHHLQAEARIQGLEVARPIVIEDNVWLGGSAILLPGVTIGRNAVVGAGAVVTRSVPPNVVVAGNPARVIREIENVA